MQPYPFTSILKIMKPCKPDTRKKVSHQSKLAECMNSDEYVYDVKLDGIHLNSLGGRLYSIVVSKATGYPSEKTEHLPQLSTILQTISPYLILDGEAYLPGKKCNRVTAITNSLPDNAVRKQQEGNEYVRYRVYDMLRDVDGTWLVGCTWEERRTRLERLFASYQFGEFVELHPYKECADNNVEADFAAEIANGGEGLVLKHKTSVYHPGKRPMWNWIKLKAELEDDVIILGFEPATRNYAGDNLEGWLYWEGDVPVTENYHKGLIGSIKIGKYDANGNIVPMGTTTGITQQLREEFTADQASFVGQVITIKAMERSEHGVYRHSNFLRFHPDKNAYECKVQEND